MLPRLFAAMVLAGSLHSSATAADSAFDDSFARSVCGGSHPPATATLEALCLEMSAVGQRCAFLWLKITTYLAITIARTAREVARVAYK